MRKNIIDPAKQKSSSTEQGGLDLASLAQVEITSEDENHPIEAAFTSSGGFGWKAAQPGEQTIRLVFDEPQKISSIQLLFREEAQERAQEFLLRCRPAGEKGYQEIVRQQYNFSPPHTTEESETYIVDLDAVKELELIIKPDTSGRTAYASLAELQLKE